jgi:hypothetical protein
MKIKLLFALAIVSIGFATATAIEPHNVEAARRAQYYTWHYRYYNTEWGTPVALVVPPTAEHQANYSWGVPSTRVTRIDHQFQRPYPGPYAPGGVGFAPTPYYPSDTRQFGVYYVRGPW